MRALWTIHDGQREDLNGFIGSLALLGVEGAMRERDRTLRSVAWLRAHEDEWAAAGVAEREIRSDGWLPLAARDADSLVVSCETGRVFSCAKDAPPLHLVAPSVAELLATYAEDVEGGRYELVDGFGDYYLARVTDEERDRRDAQASAKAGLGRYVRELAGKLGKSTRVRGDATGNDEHVLSVERTATGEEALRRWALDVNARTLLVRHCLQAGKLVSTCTLRSDDLSDRGHLELFERELGEVGIATWPVWKHEPLDRATRERIHGGGKWLTLHEAEPSFFAVEGGMPVVGAAFAGTFQMRLMLPVRAPASESGLSTLNDLNASANGEARIFLFEGQIGIAAGALLDRRAGYRAERAYWSLRHLVAALAAHTRGVPSTTEAHRRATVRGFACLASLTRGRGDAAR